MADNVDEVDSDIECDNEHETYDNNNNIDNIISNFNKDTHNISNKSCIYIACKERNIELIKILLEDYNKIDENAYFLVCSNGDIEILDLILEYNKYKNKLDIHTNNEFGLKIACRNNRLEIIKYLIKFGRLNNNRFNIHINDDEIVKIACKYNYIDIVKYIFEQYNGYKRTYTINNEYIQILYSACKSNNIELINYLIEYINCCKMSIKVFTNMFIIAMCYCNTEIIKYLFDKFPNNIRQMKPLTYLINESTRDRLDTIKYFLEDIIIDRKYYIPFFSNNICYNILCDACRYGYINITKYILNYSKKYNIKLDYDMNYECSTFNNACRSGNIELVKLLINITQPTYKFIKYGLNKACICGNYEIVIYLIDLIKQKNIIFNMTDFQYNENIFLNSIKSNNVEIIKLLFKSNSILTPKIKMLCIQMNNHEGFYDSCCIGNFEIFNFLFDYTKKINKPFDIHANIRKLILSAMKSDNISFINYLMCLDKDKTYSIIKGIICNNIILNYINHKITLQYIIEYCFRNNISFNSPFEIKLHKLIEHYCRCGYILYCNFDMIKYIIYLLKHNYNKHKYRLFMFDNCHYPEAVNHGLLKHISNWYDFIFIKKSIKYNSINYIKINTQTNCTHIHRSIINNNLVCIKCYNNLNVIHNYIFFIT